MGHRRHPKDPGGDPTPSGPAERHRNPPPARWRGAGPLLTGLIAILVLGSVALVGGSRWLDQVERERLADRRLLISYLATWESSVHDPASLRTAVDRTTFARDDPARNHLLAAQFQVTPAGDATRLVALLDRSGRALSIRPAAESVYVPDLGPAWETAWRGGNAVSPAFMLDGQVVRATVVPVGGAAPWAVLVIVSTEQSNAELAAGIGTLLRLGDGSAVSTVDANGVAVLSTDRGLPGTRLLGPADLDVIRRSADPVRLWTTDDDGRGLTHIAARQPTTGYTTYFVQPTGQLYADLRSQQSRRNITLLAVTMVTVFVIAIVGLRRESRARHRRHELRTLLAATRDIVMSVSPDGVLHYVSPAITPQLGHLPARMRGRSLSVLVHAADTARVGLLLAGTVPATLMNVRLLSVVGDERWFDLSARRLADGTAPVRVILTCHEIERRKALLDQLSFQAEHDPLTGLANRVTFDERLAASLDSRPPTGTLAVLYLDLDHFKPINDAHGHAAGDRVLGIVAGRLVAALTDQDTASRFGGDEFGVLLPGADERTASAVAGRIIDAVSEPIDLDGTIVAVDASIGIAVARADSRHPERLLRAADQAMYQAKQAGRGRFAIAVPTAADADLPGRGAPALGSATASQSAVAPESATASQSAAAPESAGSGGGGRGGGGGGGRGGGSSRPDGFQATRGPRFQPRPLPAGRPAMRTALARRVGTLFPSATVVVVLLATLCAGLAMETTARGEARQRRLDASIELVRQVAEYAGVLSDPDRLTGAVSEIPWTLQDPATLHDILRSMSSSPLAGPNSLLAVVDPEGRPLATEPPGAPLPIPVDAPLWHRASHGGALTPMLPVGGHPRVCTIVPILRNGSAAAQLLLCPSQESPVARTLKAMGKLGGEAGRGVSVLDAEGRAVLSWNSELVGRTLVSAEELERIRRGPAGRVLATHRPGGVAVAAAMPDGGYVMLDQTTPSFHKGLVEYSSAGEMLLLGIIGVTIIWLAVANRRREHAVRQDEKQLGVLLHEAHDIVIVIDRTGRLSFVSSAVEGLLGWYERAMVGHDILDFVHQDDRRAVQVFLAGPGTGGRAGDGTGGPASLQDVRLRAHDGTHRWFDVEAATWDPMPAVGRSGGLLLTCREIGERRDLQEQLRRRARHDPLTGLPNRAALAEHLDAIADRRIAFAILVIDLDSFKPVNDTFGHDVGDEVLRVTAARIRTILTPDAREAAPAGGTLADGLSSGPGPVPGQGARFHRSPAGRTREFGGLRGYLEQGTVFRIGGDEFVAVLTGPSPVRAAGFDMEFAASSTAELITETITEPIRVSGRVLSVGATVGMAVSRGVANPEAVVRLADAAMYEAKKKGPGGRSPASPALCPPPAAASVEAWARSPDRGPVPAEDQGQETSLQRRSRRITGR